MSEEAVARLKMKQLKQQQELVVRGRNKDKTGHAISTKRHRSSGSGS